MLLVNAVVSHAERQFRVLDILPDDVLWIDINDKYANPELFDKHEIISALKERCAEIIPDPFVSNALKQPSASQKRRLEEIWEVMQNVNNNPLRLHRHAWPALYKEVVAGSEATYSIKHFYTLTRKFLQRGQNKAALLPDFQKQGARNKTRKITDKKVGKKRTVTSGTGIPIDENIKELFRKAIDSYYLKVTRMPWTKVQSKVELEFRKKYPDIQSQDYPTILQLKHFFKMEYDASDTAKLRSSKIDYEKDIRPLKSTATAQVLAPGDRFEFDATIVDLYLVSDKDSTKIIGRP